MSQTIDTTLVPDRSPEARALSLALDTYIRKLAVLGSKTHYSANPNCRVFIQAATGAPAAATEDPGGDCVFIVNTADNDLYFVSDYTVADSGTFTLILD